VLAGLAAITTLPGCGGGSGGGTLTEPVPTAEGGVLAYRLSGRGRRVSNAAKSHNANKVFSSPQAADQNRAHPGDTSRVVPITLSVAAFDTLFPAGAQVADLRHVTLP